MKKETQMDRIERKLNYLILVSARPDFWKMFSGNYKGWNALSAYDNLISRPENKDYLKNPL